MLIANPIYDSVFKYLLEDTDLAREFLATILGEEIVSLEVKPQETTVEMADQTSHVNIFIFRLDFKAVIRTAAGERRKILIELQKAKHLLDIMRFRRYLADNYQKADTVHGEDGARESRALPIVTIYFLGFKLAAGYPAVFKLNHQVTNVLTGEVLASRPREPFVELLNHESYTIQIPLLREGAETRLERALLVFNQEHRTEDPHQLSYAGEVGDPLVKRMVERLKRAIGDDDLRRNMDAEDEVDRTIARLLREQAAKLQAEAQEKEARHQAELQEKEARHQAELQEKDVALQEKDAALQEQARRIAELEKQLDDKQE